MPDTTVKPAYKMRPQLAGSIRPRRKLTPPTIIRMYADGESVRSIARYSRRSYGGVHKILAASDVRFRPRGGANRMASSEAAKETA